MSRRFQFSLKWLLVSLTVACLWLGWHVERARRRGRAIDAIIAAGALAYYEGAKDDTFLDRKQEYMGHFWHDLRRLPLIMELSSDNDLDATVGRLLEQAVPIQTLGINYPVRDDALNNLRVLNDGCEVFFWHDENLSTKAICDLQRRLPNVEFP